MRHTKLALAVMASAILAACGSGSPSPGDQTLKVKFASQVSFGDSLSDVGSYKVGTVAALGGGKFTINGNNSAAAPALTGKIWIELLAAQFGLPAPCAAQTGLDGNAAKGFSVPVQNHTGCYAYGQGGARVTNPVGEGHKLTGSEVGALTVPVVTQVKNHLAAVGGKFKGDEIVFVWGGNNDLLVGLGGLSAAATAAGTAAGNTAFANSLVAQLAAGATNPQTAAAAIGLALATENAKPTKTETSVVTAAVTAAVLAGNTSAALPATQKAIVDKAKADGAAAGAKAGADYAAANGPALVPAMVTAAKDISALVKSQILANGAKYVVVNNIPDVANTPSGLSQSESSRALINAMVKAFNDTLSAELGTTDSVLIIDTFAESHTQATNPAPYGLTNVKETACDLTPAKNPLSSSLACNASNLKAGDVSHYSYADTVHPTPFLHQLLARYVAEKMVVKGWL
ncbi:esterase [Massilia sp. Root418]|jgi:phospholipase/lecithinase/hemolysin|uniref:SGNH/GDSL hydrolase family protein n=1 Tax=Massilia sp. Root418 TaxID=1736532 RepID=UPI00070027F4|nr:SGNH/GDSL hydrolase family protein [Massilia sp. Root418]KQW89198.1 esterase [Massilia sp. Root418]